MTKHHSEDYKISAVKHYLTKSKNLNKTCKEFDYSRISLKRWVEIYKKTSKIERQSRKSISYKITKEQIKYAIKKLKENQQITKLDI